MAWRNRMPRHPDDFREFHDDRRPIMSRGLGSLPIHPAGLEEEREIQHRDIRRILSENRLVIEDNTLLQRDLTAAKDEIRRLGQVIPTLGAEKDARARDLKEKVRKLEVDLKSTEPVKAEVVQLRAEIQKLNSSRKEMSAQVQGLTKVVNRLQVENQQLVSIRTDIDGVRKDILEARRAHEYEKSVNQEQVEQNQAMEKNLLFMAREIEKLRAERQIADRRAQEQGQGSWGYEALNGSPERRYAGVASGDRYASGLRYYDKQGPPPPRR
ncbi:protein FLX-like 3 [Humulus lupulus]|uniref:protein FLX-like 3 n=1 Tax=Humulus lupulus TaxID=3486 RepID=UPI002B412F1B|nr:protein FLX-like 3 [Humulus lupulus]XP_062110126.1 protein FLX-like 3 [Humulus lupulus]